VLLSDFGKLAPEARGPWLEARQVESLREVSRLRGGRHVVLYGSAFLQKPQAPSASLIISPEDVNGFMAAIHGMDWTKGLTLVLHTPGGATNATESIVDYLRAKFDDIEVIIPTFAMSAGSMISLSANRIVMGKQSQLGPIDPQMNIANKNVSARAVVEQFERAKAEILADQTVAHVWAPILQSLGPSLLQEAQNALDYSEQIVAKWAATYMFSGSADAVELGRSVAHHFNDATTHKSHGRRIGRDEARAQRVVVEDLEDNQELQDAVLTAYHILTITFEQGTASKIIFSDTGQRWVKNYVTPEQAKEIAELQKAQAGKAPQPVNRPGFRTARRK
jgi:hypothetical protein